MIVEDTYGPYPIEKALVEASQDGSTWVELGMTSDRVGTPDQVESYFDLGMLDWATYIRVSDKSVKDDFATAAGEPNGFDLNAVISLQDNTTCTIVSESAWGAGEDAGTNNWAMIIPESEAEPYYVWEYVEDLSVACDGGLPEVSVVLTADEEYMIMAEGTYRFANWGEAGIADARYSYRVPSQVPAGYPPSTDPRWVDGADLPTGWEYYLQLWIDGVNVPWVETFNEDHIYTVELTGTGSPLEFIILDSSYGDNSGALIVTIYQWVEAW